MRIERAPDFASTGRWTVRSRAQVDDTTSKAKAEVKTEVYDAVMIATGHHAQPNMPKVKGVTMLMGLDAGYFY